MNTTHAIIICGMLAAAAAGPALAGGGTTWFWQLDGGDANGEFLSLRWQDIKGMPGTPGAGDRAVFDHQQQYTITFAGDPVNGHLEVRDGEVTFDLSGPRSSGRVYTLTGPMTQSPSILVGHAMDAVAVLHVRNGSLHGQFIELGSAPLSLGIVSVSGADAALDSEGQLRIGYQGSGVLSVDDGGTVNSNSASIGHAMFSLGQVTVESGGQFTCDGSLAIGRGGTGYLSIEPFATVLSGNAIISQQMQSQGEVAISGNSAAWIINGSLDVGMNDLGSIDISEGGYLSNTTFATLGTFTDQPFLNDVLDQGYVHVRHADSKWDVLGNLYIGLAGFGTLHCSGGGTVNIDGAITRGGHGSNGTSRIFLELHSAYDYFNTPAITAAGACDAFPVIVTLEESAYTPAAGDTFKLLQAGSIDGEFTFTLPDLPDGLVWQVDSTATSIELGVVGAGPLGDVNNDGVVNVADMLLVLMAWGECDGHCPADLNGDGQVNVGDLMIVLANWT